MKYVLKTGGFYLSIYNLDDESIETNFIESIEITSNKKLALDFNYESAKKLQDIIYIEAGVNFELVEKVGE